MEVAIKTTFLGGDGENPARVKAQTILDGDAADRFITVDWNSALDATGNHIEAARQLATKLDWPGDWHAAIGASCHVFVRVEGGPAFTVPAS